MGKQQRHRRQPRRHDPTHDNGLGLVAPSIAEVPGSSEPFLEEPSWKHARRLVVPVFERLRSLPVIAPRPATLIVPPGVSVGFGIDIGPAFMRVSEVILADWRIALDEVARTAMANLRERILEAAPYRLLHEAVDGVPVVVYQSRAGWASTLVLLPDLLERVFGAERRLFVAPCRDLIIGLPPDVDRELATMLTEAFESADPNGLCLEGFLLADGRVSCTPLAREPIVA